MTALLQEFFADFQSLTPTRETYRPRNESPAALRVGRSARTCPVRVARKYLRHAAAREPKTRTPANDER
jgi:hypothetical protein